MADKPERGAGGLLYGLLDILDHISSANVPDLPRWVGRLEDALLVGLFLALVVLGLAQIGLRNISGIALPWADGGMRAGVLWIAMLASAAAARELRHIRIDVLERFLADRVAGLIQRLMMFGASVVCAAMVWFSGRMIQLERAFESNAFLNVPTWVVMLIIPIGFVLMAWRFLHHALSPDAPPQAVLREPDS